MYVDNHPVWKLLWEVHERSIITFDQQTAPFPKERGASDVLFCTKHLVVVKAAENNAWFGTRKPASNTVSKANFDIESIDFMFRVVALICLGDYVRAQAFVHYVSTWMPGRAVYRHMGTKLF